MHGDPLRSKLIKPVPVDWALRHIHARGLISRRDDRVVDLRPHLPPLLLAGLPQVFLLLSTLSHLLLLLFALFLPVLTRLLGYKQLLFCLHQSFLQIIDVLLLMHLLESNRLDNLFQCFDWISQISLYLFYLIFIPYIEDFLSFLATDETGLIIGLTCTTLLAVEAATIRHHDPQII